MMIRQKFPLNQNQMVPHTLCEMLLKLILGPEVGLKELNSSKLNLVNGLRKLKKASHQILEKLKITYSNNEDDKVGSIVQGSEVFVFTDKKLIERMNLLGSSKRPKLQNLIV